MSNFYPVENHPLSYLYDAKVRRQVSYVQLANETGLSHVYIAMVLRGKYPSPSKDAVDKIRKVLAPWFEPNDAKRAS